MPPGTPPMPDLPFMGSLRNLEKEGWDLDEVFGPSPRPLPRLGRISRWTRSARAWDSNKAGETDKKMSDEEVGLNVSRFSGVCGTRCNPTEMDTDL